MICKECKFEVGQFRTGWYCGCEVNDEWVLVRKVNE